jgi:hypothetical protein
VEAGGRVMFIIMTEQICNKSQIGTRINLRHSECYQREYGPGRYFLGAWLSMLNEGRVKPHSHQTAMSTLGELCCKCQASLEQPAVTKRRDQEHSRASWNWQRRPPGKTRGRAGPLHAPACMDGRHGRDRVASSWAYCASGTSTERVNDCET